MVRPVGRPLARKTVTLGELREEFLAHCEARNLSERTFDSLNARKRRLLLTPAGAAASAGAAVRFALAVVIKTA
jgi:DNA-binding MarR family transcriptional regulator